MMHYYAQHTATRDWFAPLLGIDELVKAQEAGLSISVGMHLLHSIGFELWIDEVGMMVGVALRNAASRARRENR